MMIPWWEHSEKGVTGTGRQTDTETETERQTERPSDFFKGKSIWICFLKNVGHFFSGLNIGLFDANFHQGVSSTKAKKRNCAYFKISEQNPVSVKKNTWYILNFIEALVGSQMKVKAVLNNFYNFISNPCTMYVPIKYTSSLYVQFAWYIIQNIIQFNIETICWAEK